jgi:hypothetical protein
MKNYKTFREISENVTSQFMMLIIGERKSFGGWKTICSLKRTLMGKSSLSTRERKKLMRKLRKIYIQLVTVPTFPFISCQKNHSNS